MTPRFFAPHLDPGQSEVVLEGEEAHHLQRVLRLDAGADVVVFDGRGTAFRGRVASIGRRTASVRLTASLQPPAEHPVSLTIVQSILKGEAMDEVVRDCTMIGVHSIQPVVSERTTVKASTLPKAADRWRRIALAACKQCGRARLPDIAPVMAFAEWLRQALPGETFMLLEPAAVVSGTFRVRDLINRPRPERAALAIGPEGGWTAQERDLALARGCVSLSLGHLTLRAEAVPLAAAAALLAIWEG